MLLFVISCEKENNGVVEEFVNISLAYSLHYNTGNSMYDSRSVSNEVFHSFYTSLTDGTLIAPTFNLTFTEINNGWVFKVQGDWANKNIAALRPGTYHVTGSSTADGLNLQEKCSITFDTQVEVDLTNDVILLPAIYDCALVIFTDTTVSNLSNNNGVGEVTDFFNYNNNYYAFVRTALYEVSGRQDAFISGYHKTGKEFSISTSSLEFQKGKYYIYNNLTKDFQLPNTEQENTEGNQHEAVDLGLPSGLLWATCNIGANKPEQYGDYFGWGEVAPNNHYNWDNYRFGDSSSFSKYNSQDGLTHLELEDDAAHVIWKEDWRMPTHDEELELANYCTIEQMNLNGVSGYKFTGPNGNSVFFPLGGLIDGTDYERLDNKPTRIGDGGWYWSSTLNKVGSDYASGICFWPSLMPSVIDHERCDGHMIRPVRGGSNNGDVISIALPPDDEIWYESHSGKTIPLAENSSLLVSNTYSNGKGVYKFSKAITEIGGMFDYSHQCGTTKENEDFKSLILPRRITHVGQFGISHLSYATKLVLPYHLSSMGSDCLCRFGEKTPDTSSIFFIGETAPSFRSTSLWNMHDLVSTGNKIDNFYYPENNDSYNSLLRITIQGSATHKWVPAKYNIIFSN